MNHVNAQGPGYQKIKRPFAQVKQVFCREHISVETVQALNRVEDGQFHFAPLISFYTYYYLKFSAKRSASKIMRCIFMNFNKINWVQMRSKKTVEKRGC